MGDRMTRNTGGNPLGTSEWLHNTETCGMYPKVSDKEHNQETMLKRMPVLCVRELLVARNLFERRWGLEGDLSVKKDLCVPQVSRALRPADQAVEMEYSVWK